MRFKGQLLLPSEPGPGLRVDLEVAGHHLAVESEDGELGAWPLETVRVRRLEGDTFAMTVAGEDLHFVADDTIAFAYSGMPAIESVTGLARSRGRLRGLFSKFGADGPSAPHAAPSTVIDDEPTLPEPAPLGDDRAIEEPESVAAEIRTLESDEIPTADEEIIDVTALDFEWRVPTQPRPATEREPHSEPEVAAPEPARAEPSHSDAEKSPSCPGLTNEGLPCQSPILASSGYCYNHDPERAVEDGYRKALEARAKMKRKGTARLTKVYSRLEKAMRQVERGDLEPDIAVAMAQIARTMCAILDLDDEEPEDGNDTGLAPRF